MFPRSYVPQPTSTHKLLPEFPKPGSSLCSPGSMFPTKVRDRFKIRDRFRIRVRVRVRFRFRVRVTVRVRFIPLAEGVQAGQHFGQVVALQADAADQELLVDLSHHWTGQS